MSTFFLIEVISKDGHLTIIARDAQQQVIDIFSSFEELTETLQKVSKSSDK